MIPCNFKDLGKRARDLLDKNFPLGQIKLCHKSSTEHNIDIEINGNHVLQTGRLLGDTNAKYKIPSLGLIASQKISTSNNWIGSLSIEDNIVNGLKNTFELTYEIASRKRSTSAGFVYRRPHFLCSTDLLFHSNYPQINASLVLGCKQALGYLAGFQASIDTQNCRVTNHEACVGFERDQFAGHLVMSNLTELAGTLYQQHSAQFQSALAVNYNHVAQTTLFTLAGVYKLSPSLSVKARVDSRSVVTLSYSLGLGSGLRLTVAGRVDGRNLRSNEHRIGFSLELGC